VFEILEFKYKPVRSWAMAYRELLIAREEYTCKKTDICISFHNGAIDDVNGQPVNKIHSVFYLMERDNHQILLSDVQLHFINMRGFVKALIDEWDAIDINKIDKFTRWLALITEKEIGNKDILKQLCEGEDEMRSAVTELVKLSADAVRRQEYQRRLDELYSYNLLLMEKEEAERRAEETERRVEKVERRAEEAVRRADGKLYTDPPDVRA